jgi:NAD-dependent dihydropyrimidine dehydrogenase PreA subunit
MNKAKLLVSFDFSKCSVCPSLICIGVCPQGILEADGGKKPRIVDAASCTLCGVCVNLCPSKAITINSSATKKTVR